MTSPHTNPPTPPADQPHVFPATDTLAHAWLALTQEELLTLHQEGRPYMTAARRLDLVQQTLARVQGEDAITPETRALLQHELALAQLDLVSTSRSQHVESAIGNCEAALQVLTLLRSPRSHARLQVTLGTAYRERIAGSPRDNRELAIQHYHDALQVLTREDEPLQYAQIQYELAETYQVRIVGSRQENLEHSIELCQQALQIYLQEQWPLEHARTLVTLAKGYLQRITGERRENLEQAIAYYRQAAQFLTPEHTPVEYAQSQNGLATTFSQRITGEQRDNLEQAIAAYHRSLRIYTREAFPVEYARVQNNLGIVYWQRTLGTRSENLERAIDCYRQAAQILTSEGFPYQYAMLQNNLGAVYVVRQQGRRRDNLEDAITAYNAALQIWTREAFPFQYGKVQNNLGEVYQLRLAGDPSDNLERAIAYYHEALQIFSRKASPTEYALTRQNLGTVYKKRLMGEREQNLRQALTCYHEALEIYTLNAFPSEHRQTQLYCAETWALLDDWEAVHAAYLSAHQAEDLLIALSTGVVGLDLILQEGRDASVRDGFALVRLGRSAEAALTIERGRARGLSQALEINTADPQRIHDPERRARYLAAHQSFIAAQAALHVPFPETADDEERRQIELERTASYRTARALFDAIVEEIHAAQDPANFFTHTFETATFAQVVERGGQGHALVYLAATPYGGFAIAVLSDPQSVQSAVRFVTLDLPSLTDELINTLVEGLEDDEATSQFGGFYSAQSGNTFELLQTFTGKTFREKATALHAWKTTRDTGNSLDAAAQFILSLPVLTPLVDQPLEKLDERSRSLLGETLCHKVLQHELQRCQRQLGPHVIDPLVAWLRTLSVSSLTIVPCGPLALLPLGGILTQDGHALCELLPTSIAPGARALLYDEQHNSSREGIYALGNPYPTRQELRWSEAEALTLALLSRSIGQPEGVRVQWEATRRWLIDALRKGYVVDASCHGVFDMHDFLRSRLLLAGTETLTLADMLSHQADLRGLRLLILSACQTAMIDLQGAHDEFHSLAAGMLQAGAEAVLATLWPVDDRATYLLMVRFAQEWFPQLTTEPPARALARAQHWLRTVTNRELQHWQAINTLPARIEEATPERQALPAQLAVVRGRGTRFDAAQAQDLVQDSAEAQDLPDYVPYAAPYYWAGFQIIGW